MAQGISTVLSTLSKFATATTLALGVAISPIAHALEVHLQRSLAVRSLSNGQMHHLGELLPGSIVEIPDRFSVRNSKGQVDPELTLNNWLQRAGYQSSEITRSTTSSGERFDFFFPIKIKRVASGSSVTELQAGQHHYMALRHLTRTNGALIVDTPATLYASDELIESPLQSSQPQPQPQPRESGRPTLEPGSSNVNLSDFVANPTAPPARANPTLNDLVSRDRRFEAVLPCADGSCTETTVAPAFDRLRRDLSSLLDRVDDETSRRAGTTIQTAEALPSLFGSHCGISLNQFMPEIRSASASEGIPVEALMSIITQESSGNCFAPGGGLFQIQPNSTRVPRCSAAQRNVIRGASSLEGLRSGPRCLENPVVGLGEAINVLKAKIAGLQDSFETSRLVSPDGTVSEFGWRLALSSYNGGERWVRTAKRDLEEFNRLHGTAMNPYNWEHLRVFYLRQGLTQPSQRQHFGSLTEGRSTENAIKNLIYVENMIPRHASVRPQRQVSLGEYWQQQLSR